MSQIFHDFIYQPIYNLLIIFYNVIPGHDLGVAIVALTLLVRFILYPIAKKQIESQKKLQELQPEIKKIQDKYKNDKEKQGRAVMEFYREKKVNPASGCLPLSYPNSFLYRALSGFHRRLEFFFGMRNLYSFVKCPELIQVKSFGFLRSFQTQHSFGSYCCSLAVCAGKNDGGQTALPLSKGDFSSAMNQQMVYLGPVLTLFIGVRFPAGLAVYWIVNTLFSIVQQYFILKEKAEACSRKNAKMLSLYIMTKPENIEMLKNLIKETLEKMTFSDFLIRSPGRNRI